MTKNLFFLFILPLFSCIVFAQELDLKSHIINGNENYLQGDYLKAESQYKQALAINENSTKGNYNLGNALYHQHKYDEARAYYDRIIQNKSTSKTDKSKAFHNIGKSYLDQNKYEEAARNFKEALKLNPNDDETRYNYALARKYLEEQQKETPDNENPENSDKKGDNKENENSDKEKQGKEEGENNEGEQEKEQKDQGKEKGGQDGNEEGQSDKPQEQQLTKGSDGKGQSSENALDSERQERMLEALKQQEQETLKRIINQKAKKTRSNAEKDW